MFQKKPVCSCRWPGRSACKWRCAAPIMIVPDRTAFGRLYPRFPLPCRLTGCRYNPNDPGSAPHTAILPRRFHSFPAKDGCAFPGQFSAFLSLFLLNSPSAIKNTDIGIRIFFAGMIDLHDATGGLVIPVNHYSTTLCTSFRHLPSSVFHSVNPLACRPIIISAARDGLVKT